MFGGHIGRYTLLERLGHGGMAEVFLARPRGDERGVLFVVKRILPQHAADPRFVQMFDREVHIAATLCHPNLVSVVDHGHDGEQRFLVMEYVHGTDLGHLLQRAGECDVRPPLDAALSIVTATARGLDHLHERPDRLEGGSPQIVHRDATPSNVLLGFDGTVKVTDFGIATATAYTRTTDAGSVKGKMGYLSPEQCRSEPLDRRSDVFALGVLLYETTLGERLFLGDNDYAVMHQIISGDFEPPTQRDPEYPPALEAIVLRALSSDRQDRFPTAAAMAQAVETFATTIGCPIGPSSVANWVQSLLPVRPYPAFPIEAPAPPVPTPLPTASTPTRSPLWIGLGLGVLGTAAVALVLASARADEPTNHEPPSARASSSEAVHQAPAADPSANTPPPVRAAPPVPAPVPVVAEPPPPADLPSAEPAADDPLVEVEQEAPPPAPERKRRRARRRKKSSRAKAPRYDLDAPRPPQ